MICAQCVYYVYRDCLCHCSAGHCTRPKQVIFSEFVHSHILCHLHVHYVQLDRGAYLFYCDHSWLHFSMTADWFSPESVKVVLKTGSTLSAVQPPLQMKSLQTMPR